MLTLSEIVERIRGQRLERPTAIALEEVAGATITYDALVRDIDAVASGLIRRGLQPGAHVLFTVPPSIASITLILALVRVGATIIAADPRMGSAVFASRMAMARPTWIFADSRVYCLGSRPVRSVARWFGLELPTLADLEAQHVRVGRRLPGVPASVSIDALRSSSPQEIPAERSRSLRIVLFTSGTTASPKAVVHDVRSIGASMEMLLEHLRLTADDVVFSSDLYLNVPALMVGARSVIVGSRSLSPQRWIEDVTRYRSTVASSVPSEIARIAEVASKSSRALPASLRLLLLGSAPAHRGLLQRLRTITDPATAVWSVYAMTEMLPVCAVSMTEKLQSDGAGDLVGRPFRGVNVRVSADGEILLRGPNLFCGYLGDAVVEEHATGDLGMVDELGRIVILGRRKQMIIRGRDNIYPQLIEGVVDTIAGVRRSCLCGYYDERRADERLVLVLEPMDGQDPNDLTRRVRQAISSGTTRIDANAIPDHVEVMQLPIEPRSRKVDRAAVVERVRRASA